MLATRTQGCVRSFCLMNSCPTCNREYSDETMRFCLDDGTALVPRTGSARSGDATWQLPNPLSPPATIRSTQPPAEARATFPPGEPLFAQTTPTASKPGATRRNSALLFVLGAIVLGAAAVAVAFIATRNRGQNTNANQVASASPSPAGDSLIGALSTNPSTSATETKSATPKDSSATSQKAAESPAPTQEPVRKEIKTVYMPPGSNQTAAPEAPDSPKDTNQPAPPKPQVPKSISGGVLNGRATYLAKPSYPAIAKTVRASGTVQVQVTVDENGDVISASAISGHPLLRGSAVAAARASKFSPTKLSGQPVKVTGIIVYNFVAQ